MAGRSQLFTDNASSEAPPLITTTRTATSAMDVKPRRPNQRSRA
jgi:hypothetical protein